MAPANYQLVCIYNVCWIHVYKNHTPSYTEIARVGEREREKERKRVSKHRAVCVQSSTNGSKLQIHIRFRLTSRWTRRDCRYDACVEINPTTTITTKKKNRIIYHEYNSKMKDTHTHITIINSTQCTFGWLFLWTQGLLKGYIDLKCWKREGGGAYT